jgi:homoserine dehydrogenase
VSIVGDAVGRMFFHGLGAGQMPTASAVVADIIDTVVGRTAITFRTTGVLDVESPQRIMGADFVERHFLRVQVVDRPGVLARVTGILGEHGVSIASVIQHAPAARGGAAPAADGVVPLVIMTHACGSTAVRRAVTHIDASDVVTEPAVFMSVLDD